jgi:cysteine desulfurase
MRQVYLDYAAATPLDPDVMEAMKPYFSEKFHNPSATYLAARGVRSELENARHRASAVIGAKPAEIIFTAGATEANNLAIQGVMRKHPGAEILVSSIEHESVLEPARLFSAKEIPVNPLGQIILNKLSNLISDETVLISVMLVNNELGSIQPLAEIAKLIGQIRKRRQNKGNQLPLYLHSDAAQAGNYLDMHFSRLGVDMMSLNGGKIYGPKQSGILYIKTGVELEPLIVGGGQEFGLRSGTENVASAIGFAAALEIAQARRQTESKRVMQLRRVFADQLAEKIPQVKINGPKKHIAPHLINVTIPDTDNERLMMELDEAGIICAVGSACSASRDEASHVLSAIGLSESEARSTLRFSMGRQTAQADIKAAVTQLALLTSSNR